MVQKLRHGGDLFDRLEKTCKGHINFDYTLDIMGSDGHGKEAEESYRKIFIDGLQDDANNNIIDTGSMRFTM